MDGIARLVSENWVMFIVCVLAAVGLLWLLSRFFKLTVIVVLAVLLLLAYQHFNSAGDIKTKFNALVERVTGKTGDAMKGTKEFFSAQKSNLQRNFKSADNDKEANEAEGGGKKK
jgi:hypothetical protein